MSQSLAPTIKRNWSPAGNSDEFLQRWGREAWISPNRRMAGNSFLLTGRGRTIVAALVALGWATRVNKLLPVFIVLLVCQGCASTPSHQAAAVKEADARQVAKCTLISTIVGKSLIGGVGSTGATNAIVDAKEQASGLGATHVVILSVDSGSMYSTGTATAKAYKCN